MDQVNLTLDSEILKGLFTAEGKDEAFAGLVSTILNQVLNVQASAQVGAGSYERSEDKQNYRNRSRERRLNTMIGKLRLLVQAVRKRFQGAAWQRCQSH